MKCREFIDLPELNDMSTPNRLRVGLKFLTGTTVIGQKEEKKAGDLVTYYQVVSSDDRGNVSYKPVYEKLEE